MCPHVKQGNFVKLNKYLYCLIEIQYQTKEISEF